VNGCEHAEAEHAATRRLTFATWTLCLVTAMLVVATVLLAAATAEEKQHADTGKTETEVVTTRR
jgi:heme/copper-type cytochrome/quinol oxidase subunit 2